MTTIHIEDTFTSDRQSQRTTAAAAPARGDGGVWLPVIVAPSTFIFCVVMFFILRVR